MLPLTWLELHVKGELQWPTCGAGRPGLGRPAWPCCHLSTDFAWTAFEHSRRSVSQVVSSDTRILGQAACLWHSSALYFTDIAHQRSTLPLDWVLSSFDVLGTGMWVFGLNLVPSGSTDRIWDVRLVLKPYEHVTLLQCKYRTHVCGGVRPVGTECAGRPGFSLISTIFVLMLTNDHFQAST